MTSTTTKSRFLLTAGRTLAGEDVDVDIRGNVAIFGMTGSGKSALIVNLIKQALDNGLKVVCVSGFDMDASDTATSLNRVVEEIHSRFETLRTDESVSRFDLSPLLVVIEDVENLDLLVKQELATNLSVIGRLGRIVAVHLIAGFQRPASRLLPPELRTQLNTRLVCERRGSGAQMLPDSYLSEVLGSSGRVVQARAAMDAADDGALTVALRWAVTDVAPVGFRFSQS